MMPSDATTEATGAEALGQLEDLDGADAIDELVGRCGYLSNWTADDCLLPSERDERGEEEAVFDRYYFPTNGSETVFVDELAGGSEVEVAQQEADKQVALKREWCKARGLRYLVWIDPLLSEFS